MTMPPTSPPSLLRPALWLAALAALALVFMSYLQPELIVELGNRVWSCVG